MESIANLTMTDIGCIATPAAMRAYILIQAGQHLHPEIVDGGIFISTS